MSHVTLFDSIHATGLGALGTVRALRKECARLASAVVSDKVRGRQEQSLDKSLEACEVALRRS